MWMNWNLKFSFALCLVYLFNRLWPIICPIRLGLIPTTKFYMHDMQIKEMQPSNGFCRQAVNLIEMLDQCCLEQILSSMNTILGQLQGNYEFIFPQQCSLKYKVIFFIWKRWYIHWLGQLMEPKEMDFAHSVQDSGIQINATVNSYWYPLLGY